MSFNTNIRKYNWKHKFVVGDSDREKQQQQQQKEKQNKTAEIICLS